MIVAFKHQDMSSVHQGQFFQSLLEFAAAKFKIKVTDDGDINIDGHLQGITYVIGDKRNQYTKEEVIRDFVNSSYFKSYAKAHFWTVYKIKEQII